MSEVVQSLKMVQRVTEYQDSIAATSTRPNLRQSSTTYESDGTSSMFSSGPFSGLSVFDNDNVSRTAVFSEDLHEGRWDFMVQTEKKPMVILPVGAYVGKFNASFMNEWFGNGKGFDKGYLLSY